MNPKRIFNLFSPKGKAQTVVQQGVSTLIISSVVLLLALLVACGQVPIAEPETGQSAPVEVVVPQTEDQPLTIETEATTGLAWPPRPTQFHIAENAGVSLDESALAVYHQSEWDRTPSTVVPIVENALAKYHQSEWGRMLSTVLPISKNKTDADQDTGLMEFFAAPDETSRQPTEPGTLEALPNIDPADRKFFNPGYGAMIGVSKEAEALPTIETDRDGDLGLMEFFIVPNEAGAPQAIETHADQDIGLMEFRP